MERILQLKVEKWIMTRDETIQKMNEVADRLEELHSKHKENRYNNAKRTLLSDFVGLGGVVLAPFSGGISLVATGAAAGMSIGSWWSNHKSSEHVSKVTTEGVSNVKRLLDRYETETEELVEICNNIEKIKELQITMKVCSIIDSKDDESRKETEDLNLNENTRGTPTDGHKRTFAATHVRAALGVTTTLKNATQVIKATRAAKSAQETSRFARLMQATKLVKDTKAVTAASKMASISKVSVGVGVLFIPLDIYEIVTAGKEMNATPEDVKKLRDKAEELRDENLKRHLSMTILTFEEIYAEVLKGYINTKNRMLYDFLEICRTCLNLNLPTVKTATFSWK